MNILTETLLDWYADNKRDLPWRDTADPYRIWISEIILQQTRVVQGYEYFLRFIRRFPDVETLAAASEDEVLKYWQGLGYYSRARNLHAAAKSMNGKFPASYQEVRALKGVGDYTAGAVASICFDVPEPAVDGNVLRVLSRVTQDTAPVTRPAVKKAYETALRPVYAANPGKRSELTQALMELGACVCVPNGAPKCDACPLRTVCLAEKSGAWASLPVKEAKKPRRIEEKTVFFLQCGGQYAVRKRPETGLLAGLWELPNVEGTLDAQQALALLDSWGLVPEELTRTRERTHIFTHVEWRMRCYDIRVSMLADSFTWVSGTRFQQDIALPTAFRIFWQPEDAE